ncbi:MAG: helix-turn-helix domain-containing protein [Phycisphaeraceae bacterium]|nr:helix-turn-helix domain-containing protein [Phycisphaeraceae bacterium]
MAKPRNDTGTASLSPRRLLTVNQAAELLAISVRSVWRLISLGELAKVQVGRSVRITSESLDAFIARGGAK